MQRFLNCSLFGLALALGIQFAVHPAFAADPVEYGYRDFSFGSSLASGATGEKPESKLWWNDGNWWGCLYDTSRGRHYIHKFDLATHNWQNTLVAVDDRETSKADVLWDQDTRKLYISSHYFTTSATSTTSQSQWGRLYRYTYDAGQKTYTLDSGFPALVTRGRCEALTIAKDSTGKLWVTYVESQKVLVNRSTTSDAVWGTPFALPARGTTGNTGKDDISVVLSFQDNKIGVMWSNQSSKKVYFAIHVDGDPDDLWSPEETALPGPNVTGNYADDHLNLKSVNADGSGRVFAAIKTSLTQTNAPLIMLLVRDLQGNWTNAVFGRVSDNHTRPIVLIAEGLQRVFIFAQSSDPGGTSRKSIYYKSSPLNNVSFPTGKGDPFIRSALDADINNVTSTKQNLDGATGLLVLASDDSTNFYLHNFLTLGASYTLTVNTQGNGTVSPSSGSYPQGSTVTLTATPASGYEFSGWSGDLSGTANPASLVMNSDKTVTATFTASSTTQYTLSTMTVGSGSVSLSPPGGTYDADTQVQLTATPATDYEFSGWSGDLTGSTNPATVTMNADKVITATFTQTGGGGGGTITFEGVTTGASQNSNTVATSTNVAAASGNLYLAAVSTRSLLNATSVTGLGLTWSHVKSQCSSRAVTGVSIWAAQGTPSGDGTVTATLSGTAMNAVLVVARYSGVNPSGAVGNTASANPNGVSGSCGTGTDTLSYAFPITTSQPDATVFSAVALRNRTHQPGSPYIERAEIRIGDSGAVAGIAAMDRTVASPGTVNVNGTFNSTTDWAAVAVEIVP